MIKVLKMNRLYFMLFSIFFIQCNGQQVKNETAEAKKIRQEAIIQEHVYDCADKINYTSRMQEYQACLDAGLKKDSTIEDVIESSDQLNLKSLSKLVTKYYICFPKQLL